MKNDISTPVNFRADLVHPLNELVTAAAESLEAFTIAIYVKSASDKSFRVISHRTLSQHFSSESPLFPEKSRIVGLLKKGSTSHETHASVPPLAQEMYSKPEPVMAMIVAPITDNAFLVVDTAELQAFQPGHIRFVQGVARTIEGILSLVSSSTGIEAAKSEFSSITELLNDYRTSSNASDTFLDGIVTAMVNKGRFDGALIATVSVPKMACRLRSVAGFSSSLNKGRIVKLRPGWAKWSVEQLQTVIVTAPKQGEGSIPIFHVGEALGFPIRSAVIIPWARNQEVDGFIVLASRNEDTTLDRDRQTWEFLGSILAIVRSNIVNEKLLKAVRLYDGETGLMNESSFRSKMGIKFFQLAAERCPSLLLLVQIENVDSLYLEHDTVRIKRFLTVFTEKLLNLDKRKSIVGKFRTGGFGSFIENVPLDEATRIIHKLLGLFNGDSTHVDGVEIIHSVRIGWCHYPTECSAFEEMWRQSLARLSKNKPTGKGAYGWAKL